MSEHESGRVETADAEVEGHNWRKPGHRAAEGEAPEGVGERGETADADVEGHNWRKPGHV